MSSSENTPMYDLLRQHRGSRKTRTRTIRCLAWAETWDWKYVGRYPSLDAPAQKYVESVWPAKLLAIKGFGRLSLAFVEDALASVGLKLPPNRLKP